MTAITIAEHGKDVARAEEDHALGRHCGEHTDGTGALVARAAPR